MAALMLFAVQQERHPAFRKTAGKTITVVLTHRIYAILTYESAILSLCSLLDSCTISAVKII